MQTPIKLPLWLLIFAASLADAGAALAQNEGRNLALDIQVQSVTTRGDTVAVTSRVTNRATSQDSLLMYMVDAPSGITLMTLPGPKTQWDSSNNFRARPMAYWSSLSLVAPGATTPDLYFESIGVPAITDYWAQGYFELGSNSDIPDSSAVVDALGTQMINGKTVGVSPWPVDRTPAGLLARLRSLTQATCGVPLQWITNATLCTQLISDIDQAENHRSAGQVGDAKNTLLHYTGLLGTPSNYASGVSSSAFWLLKVNADTIYGML